MSLNDVRRKRLEKALGCGPFRRVPWVGGDPVSNCYWNVARRVAEEGGELVLGWMVQEWPGFYVEALHHAVWRQPGGDLVDTTGQWLEDPPAHITFAFDPSIPFNGRAPCVSNRLLQSRYPTEAEQLFQTFEDQLVSKREILAEAYSRGWVHNQGPIEPFLQRMTDDPAWAADLNARHAKARKDSGEIMRAAEQVPGISPVILTPDPEARPSV